MKTKLSLLAALSSFVFVGCSQQTTPQNKTTAQVPATAPTVEPANANESAQQSQVTMNEFLTAFSGEKFSPVKGHPVKIEKQGEGCGLLGAKDCVNLNFYSGDVQVLEFDTSITSGKEALERLKKDGFMGQSYQFNKNLAIAKFNKVPQWDKVKAVFEGL